MCGGRRNRMLWSECEPCLGKVSSIHIYIIGDNKIMCQQGGLHLFVMKDLAPIVLQNKEQSFRIIV